MTGWLRRLADAILGRVPGKVGRFDTATRMMGDADFAAPVVRSAECDRRPYAEPEIDPLEELRRAVSADDSDSGVPPSLPRAADGAGPIRSSRRKTRRRGSPCGNLKPPRTDEAEFTGITWPVARTNAPRMAQFG